MKELENGRPIDNGLARRISFKFTNVEQFNNISNELRKKFKEKLHVNNNDMSLIWKREEDYSHFLDYIVALNSNVKKLEIICKHCSTKLQIAASKSKQKCTHIKLKSNNNKHRNNCPYHKISKLNHKGVLKLDSDEYYRSLTIWEKLEYLSSKYNNVIVFADYFNDLVKNHFIDREIKTSSIVSKGDFRYVELESVFCIYVQKNKIKELEKNSKYPKLHLFEIPVRNNNSFFYIKLYTEEYFKNLLENAKDNDKFLISFNNSYINVSKNKYRIWNWPYKPLTEVNIYKPNMEEKNEEK